MSLRRKNILLDSKLFLEGLISEDILTKEWITGVEKWWRQWVNNLEDKIDTVWDKEGMSPSVIEAWKAYLEDGQVRVARIKENVIFTKGLWVPTVGNRKQDFAKTLEIPLSGTDKKIEFKGLSKLIYKIQDVIEYFEGQLDVVDTGKLHVAFAHYDVAKKWKSQMNDDKDLEEWQDKWEEKIGEDGDAFLEKVDKIMTNDVFKLLFQFEKDVVSNLKKHASKSKIEQPYPFEEYDIEANVGKLRIKFDMKEWDYNPTALKTDQQSGRLRSPKEFKEYINLFKEAKSLLDKHKFGHVWYGEVMVYPSSEGKGVGVSYARGRAFKTADLAGSYRESSDVLNMFIDPVDKNETLRVIVHELGHRHWRKLMDNEARVKFQKFYGQIKFISQYAQATNPEEEFCDTLAAYVVTPQKLTKDQRERFAQITLKSGVGIREPLLRNRTGV